MSASTLNHDVLLEIMSYLDVGPRSTWGRTPTRKPFLCACALTCRDWLAPAKAHLYRTTDFYIDDGLQTTSSISTLVDLFLVVEQWLLYRGDRVVVHTKSQITTREQW
jgi:hypothetical protein